MEFDAALLFALGTALAYAVADVTARFGLERANAVVGAMTALASSVMMFIVVIAALDVRFPPWGVHYLWMILGGALNPGVFFVTFFIGISKIGVSRAAPIKGSSAIFAALLAMAFLGEDPAWYNLAGILLVVAGIAVISSGAVTGHWRRVDMLWPLGAAVAGAGAALCWRIGVQSFPDTVAAAAVAILAALVVITGYTLATRRREIRENVRVGWKYFIVAGAIEGFGKFLYASALQLGEIYRMLPLIQTSPLFVVLISLVVLRRAERITWRVPAGAVLTVGGAILVNVRLG
ncbi:MAG: EamA family transporter [Deltaproteobacteria bacterium]|nr:EamA family transporter [Deltaproteobacteria bacterium]